MNFFQKYKKIFLIIGFVVLVFLFAFILYSVFFKPTSQPAYQPGQETGQKTPSAGLPEAETGTGQIIEPDQETGIPQGENIITPSEEQTQSTASPIANGKVTQTKELNNVSSLNPTLNSNGKDLQYYNESDGKFYKIDEDGNIQVLSDKTFYNVESVEWSPKDNKAIIEFPDGSNILYNFDTNKQVTLPKHWEDFNFSPNGSQIVMKSIGLDQENRWLAISNDDGSSVKAIENIGENGDSVYPDWSPNNQIVATYTQGLDFDRQEVYFIGLNDENFKSTIIEGRGFESKWSEEGDKLLYSVYSTTTDLKPNLWSVSAQGDSIGQNRINLNLETWAEKCTFVSNSEMYCAVPNELPEAAGLFPELKENTVDSLYKVNITTGAKNLVAVPDKDVNMTNLTVTEDGSILYFTDRQTGTIHKINLK